MSRGVYLRTDAPIGRGAIVGACLPKDSARFALSRGYIDSGRCSSGLRPIMKYVAAIPGDSVEVREVEYLLMARR